MSQTKPTINRDQQLAELAEEYLDCVRKNKPVDMKDFLGRCPDEAFERSFLKIVNTTQLYEILAKAEKYRRQCASQHA